MMMEKITILAIDDTAANLGILETLLEVEGYAVLVAINGEMGLEIAKTNKPDVILLDIMMPGWNGFETAREIKKIPRLADIPILFLSALDDIESKIHAFDAGGVDYINKPFQAPELLARIKNHHELHLLKNNLQQEVDKKTFEINRSYQEAIRILSLASEYKDYETGLHNSRLGIYAALVAKTLNCEKGFVDMIQHAAPLHDVGKIGIPDKILHKPGSFNQEELMIMQGHASIGGEILRSGGRSESPLLMMAADIAVGHHEKYDGTGYPAQLAGKEIPLSARITSVCDVYDALRSVRPYKKGFSHEKTVSLLMEGDRRTKPCHFDPDVLACFYQLNDKFNAIFTELNDEVE